MPPNDLLDRLSTALGDRYDVQREVGEGGMAKVFVARDLRHDRAVAIKVLLPELQGGVTPRRFLSEIRTAANLQHPHILPLFDSGEADGLLYYTMPFVEGVTLKERLEEHGPLDLHDFLTIGGEVADGLAYAHRQGLIHRDVKPSNILLSNGHALLADFGLARAIEVDPASGLTQSGTFLGTSLYMSPEQAGGQRDIDQRGDIYSLACVYYQMLSGKPPYEGSTALAVIAAHVAGDIPSVSDVRSDVPISISRTIERAMAKSPDERFESVEAFWSELQEAVGGAPPRYRLPKPARWRAPALVRLAAFAALLLGSVVGVYQAYTSLGGGTGLESTPRLVVLPFDHLGDPEYEALTAGISEELMGRLGSVGQLSVVGRLSAMQYRDTDKTLDQMADELDVDYVLDGSVQWTDGSGATPSMRIRPSLIRTADGEQVWFQSYESGVRNIFEVQSAIAQRVVEALGLVLGESQQGRLASEPTDNPEAYQLYLQGNDYYNRSWARSDVETAADFYRRAADLDPRFALALARLGDAHVSMYYRRYDRSEGRRTAAQAALDSAIAIDPQLAEAHIGKGAYAFRVDQDLSGALSHLEVASSLSPSDQRPLEVVADIRQRQGQFAEAIATYERITEIDPRNANAWLSLGDTRLFARRFDAAEPAIDRAISLEPAFSDAYLQKVRVIIGREADVTEARRVFEAAVAEIGTVRWRSSLNRLFAALYDAEEILDRLRPGEWGLTNGIRYDLAMGEVLGRLALEDSAQVHWESARASLESELAADPSQHWVPSYLGIVYAALGLRAEAIQSARRAVELLPIGQDALEAPEYLVNLAQVYTMIGEQDTAVEVLESALSVPSWLNLGVLITDPIWDPLRGHPGFEALLANAGDEIDAA